MRIHKKVLSRDSGTWLLCCWDDCEKQGYDLYAVINRENPGHPCKFVFCSERHKHYFLNSHIHHGQLPEGSRSIIG